MLFHVRVTGGGVFHEQMYFGIHTDLDVPTFKEAWARTIARHPSLRISVNDEASEIPVQRVHTQVAPEWVELDWRAADASRHEAMFQAQLRADRERPFDVTRPALVRLTLCRKADDDYLFLWSFHHLISDGWGLAVVLKDLLENFRAIEEERDAELPELKPFTDYLSWLQAQDADQSESWWREALGGFYEPTALPLPRNTISDDALRHKTLTTNLNPQVWETIQDLVRTYRITPNILLHGAWTRLLGTYASVDDILFGATVSGRPGDLEGVEQMVGVFFNTLPVRNRVTRSDKASDWMQEMMTHG